MSRWHEQHPAEREWMDKLLTEGRAAAGAMPTIESERCPICGIPGVLLWVESSSENQVWACRDCDCDLW
jgi:hypothetical protein